MINTIFRSFFLCLLPLLAFATTTHAEKVVRWDALKKLDTLAERCEAMSETKNVKELRKLVKPVKAAADIVVADRVPPGARSPEQVRVLQADLKSLTDALVAPGPRSDAELIAILAGIDPIVGKLMEAAGMPHVHDHEEHDHQPTKGKKP